MISNKANLHLVLYDFESVMGVDDEVDDDKYESQVE